jgi:hypothetical protein
VGGLFSGAPNERIGINQEVRKGGMSPGCDERSAQRAGHRPAELRLRCSRPGRQQIGAVQCRQARQDEAQVDREGASDDRIQIHRKGDEELFIVSAQVQAIRGEALYGSSAQHGVGMLEHLPHDALAAAILWRLRGFAL